MKTDQLAIDKGWENLATSIVMQAVEDYRRVIRGKRILEQGKEHNRKKIIEEIEEFFLSDWFYILTNVDGQTILKRLRREYYNECKTNSTNS